MEVFGIQECQQSDNYKQKMNIQIQIISRKEFKRNMKRRSVNPM